MMCDMYRFAYYLILYVVDTGIKWADLVKQSTMIHMELYPREVRSRPTMKPTHMFFSFPLGNAQGL
jgi:hypothetical protein